MRDDSSYRVQDAHLERAGSVLPVQLPRRRARARVKQLHEPRFAYIRMYEESTSPNERCKQKERMAVVINSTRPSEPKAWGAFPLSYDMISSTL